MVMKKLEQLKLKQQNRLRPVSLFAPLDLPRKKGSDQYKGPGSWHPQCFTLGMN
jgi:hypothetical protein